MELEPRLALCAELGWKTLGLSHFLLSRGRSGSREDAAKTELDCLKPIWALVLGGQGLAFFTVAPSLC